MPEHRKSNLSLHSNSMGLIVIQPTILEINELEQSSVLIYPHAISKESFNAAVEWAAGSQTPIFCTLPDVERFEREGFGAYRFLKLDGYREVDFQGGALEFFPAKNKLRKGIQGLSANIRGWLGMSVSTNSYHVLIRSKGEHSVLYLATPYLDASEWEALNKSNPQTIIASSAYHRSEWNYFSKQTKRNVILAEETQKFITIPSESSQNRVDLDQRENPLWAARTGSL